MKFRCDVYLNGGHRRLILVSQQQETVEHLALKLTGFLVFWDLDPKVEVSSMRQFERLPGAVPVWVKALLCRRGMIKLLFYWPA